MTLDCIFCDAKMTEERDGFACECGAIFVFCERGEKPTSNLWRHARDRLGYYVSAEDLSQSIDDWLTDEDCDALDA